MCTYKCFTKLKSCLPHLKVNTISIQHIETVGFISSVVSNVESKEMMMIMLILMKQGTVQNDRRDMTKGNTYYGRHD